MKFIPKDSMTKNEFLSRVWEKITIRGTLVSDAILDTAIHLDIDVETAARIVSSNPELKKLLEEESIELRTVKAKK